MDYHTLRRASGMIDRTLRLDIAAKVRRLKRYLDAAQPDGPSPSSQLPQGMRHQAGAHMAARGQAGALYGPARHPLQGASSRSSLLKDVGWEAEDLRQHTSLHFTLQKACLLARPISCADITCPT